VLCNLCACVCVCRGGGNTSLSGLIATHNPRGVGGGGGGGGQF